MSSATFPSLYLHHNSFSNPSVALPTSQLILQPIASPTSQFILLPFFCFSYVTSRAHSQPFRHFTYVIAHSDSPSFLSLRLHHSSFSNPSLALPMSQLILQPFCCFTYVTAHSPTLLSPLLRHRIFTYVNW